VVHRDHEGRSRSANGAREDASAGNGPRTSVRVSAAIRIAGPMTSRPRAQVSVFAGMGVQAEHRQARPGDAPKSI